MLFVEYGVFSVTHLKSVIVGIYKKTKLIGFYIIEDGYPFSGARSYHGAATVGHVMYIIGGFDGNDYTKTVTAFYPVTGQWRKVAPMHEKR